jgi:hypothetical protein
MWHTQISSVQAILDTHCVSNSTKPADRWNPVFLISIQLTNHGNRAVQTQISPGGTIAYS